MTVWCPKQIVTAKRDNEGEGLNCRNDAREPIVSMY